VKRSALVLAGGLLLGSASALAADPTAPAAPVAAPPVVQAPPAPVAAVPAAAAPSPAPAKPADWLRKDKPVAARTLDTKRTPSPLRVGGMLLLVATLGGVAYYAKRKKQLAKPVLPKGEKLHVLGTTRVGPKASAVVVEIGGKRILLGVTENAVSTLAWLDDERDAAVEVSEDSQVSARATTRAVDDVAAAGPSGFLRVLRNAVGTGVKPAAPVDELARSTRDEVRLSKREPARTAPVETEAFEGQVMGLAKRRKEQP
jgi:flagellar biogenesis protein FliO